MTWLDTEAEQEDPPDTEPDYETHARDELARDAGMLDEHVWCDACGAMTPECYSTCNNCGCDWNDTDDVGPDEDEELDR